MAAAVDGEVLAVDPGLERTVDRLEEVVAVVLDVERQQVVAEQPVEDGLLPRADAERLGVRPRDVPELAHHRVGPHLLDHPRQQREVVVLHEDNRLGVADFVEHGIGEAPVDLDVLAPVAVVEHRARVGDVAQRPQGAVGQAVVVAVLLARRQPHPPQGVGRIVGRHAETAARVRRLAIAGAAAVRDPGAAARPHHRIECGDQAAGRLHPVHPRPRLAADQPADQPRRPHVLHVDVRLAIGDDNQARVAEPLGHVHRQGGCGHDAAPVVVDTAEIDQRHRDVGRRLEAVASARGPAADDDRRIGGAEGVLIGEVVTEVGDPRRLAGAPLHVVGDPAHRVAFGPAGGGQVLVNVGADQAAQGTAAGSTARRPHRPGPGPRRAGPSAPPGRAPPPRRPWPRCGSHARRRAPGRGGG